MIKTAKGKQKAVTQLGIWVETKAKLSALGSIFTLCQKLLTCATRIISEKERDYNKAKDCHSNASVFTPESAFEGMMN